VGNGIGETKGLVRGDCLPVVTLARAMVGPGWQWSGVVSGSEM
jgi:hypothetical protein